MEPRRVHISIHGADRVILTVGTTTIPMTGAEVHLLAAEATAVAAVMKPDPR
ncbi:hypothetical protein [Mycolicibacter arupensis]|uniref:hypothetical protein n=1 Tax=Mycolicibacter arupensis TaxID=342002 RepID=UPI0023F2C11B|nr:hypothetical protein [Mycolicibacter arupensis]